jgi:ankyrin repeat protein
MVESRSLPPERVAAFLEYACPDARVIGPGARRSAQNAAMRILTRHPDIARDSLYTAVVCGDLEEVGRILSVRPHAAQAMLERHPEYLHDPGPMMTAARLDRLDVAALLLDLGMSPDVSDTGGARALHMAAGANALRVTRLLVERGAEIDFRDPAYDATPFGWAVHYDQPRTIEYLRRISRDVFNLAGTGHVERLRQVLSAEPERAKEMHWGVTPLFCLPDDEQRAMEVVELFLACGTDPAIRNRAGLTAEECARKEGFEEVAARLQF